MFYSRQIYPELLDHLPKKQILMITGMRRTGKTTLIKRLMEESAVRQKHYFDLERIDNRSLFSETNYETIRYALGQIGTDFYVDSLLTHIK